MKIKRTIAPIAAMLMSTAQPCLAADLLHDPAPTDRRTGTFAGGTVRLALGAGAKERKPQARLQAGFLHERGRRGSAVRDMQVSGFSLGSGRKGNATLFLGGTDIADFRKKAGISTGGAIAIGVGATLVALVAIAAAAGPPDIGCALADDPDDC